MTSLKPSAWEAKHVSVKQEKVSLLFFLGREGKPKKNPFLVTQKTCLSAGSLVVAIPWVDNSYSTFKQSNFRKIKVALNPMYKICLNFAKSYILSCLSKFYNKKKFHRAVFEI